MENQEVDQRKTTPLEYPDPELEIGHLKAIQDWIEEERLKFEAKRARKGVYFGTEGGSLAEPAKSIRQEEFEVKIPQPLQLQEVLGSNIQIHLNTLLECIPNLRENLVAWVANERKPP